MQMALRWLGAFLLVDLLAAAGLAVLVALAGRRGRTPVPLKTLFGLLIFLGMASALIYGGLWMVLRFAGT